MTSSVVQVQRWSTKLKISLPIMKQCNWNLVGMLHPTNYTRCYTFWCCYGSSLFPLQNQIPVLPFVKLHKAKYTQKCQRGDQMEGGTGIGLRQDQVFCLVELQMVISNFEEAGDWNWACCHSNINMCTILNFRKFKVALNPKYRICLNFAKSFISSCLSKFYNMKKFHRALFEI